MRRATKKAMRGLPVEELPRNPFLAVPRAVEDLAASAEADSGCIVLSRRVSPRRGLVGWLGKRFGGARTARLRLDEVGSFFWNQIDGRRDLDDIAKRLGRRFGFDETAYRRAALQFVQDLMVRNLIRLEVPRMKAARGSENP